VEEVGHIGVVEMEINSDIAWLRLQVARLSAVPMINALTRFFITFNSLPFTTSTFQLVAT
jgi:hypothetical protein